VKCRPPNNRNPLPEEITSCFEYLRTQIRLVNPSVIIALGRIASNALLGNESSLTSVRGRVHSFEKYPMIATYHPASLLRNPSYKAYAWEDLQLALRVLKP
jgi:uracil-DNA glycosylase family 4